MVNKYYLDGAWSENSIGSLLYTATAREVDNHENIIAIFTTEIPTGARKKFGDSFLKQDTVLSTNEQFKCYIKNKCE